MKLWGISPAMAFSSSGVLRNYRGESVSVREHFSRLCQQE
ncbi:hypothetical protein PCH70_06010 [Pseudomonas cichorii JBC1]|nr:hypothetical protein PCH70_06010 [Pseudomonas cichorii JBC1]